MNKPILAFMQNMWLKSPSLFLGKFHHIAARSGEEAAEEYRLQFIKRALFYRCVTGRRIMAAFGQELIDQIVWEESTREIGTTASSKFLPDFHHMHKCLVHHQPKVVLTFGAIAGDAFLPVAHMDPATRSIPQVRCVHPAARGSNVTSELLGTARRLRDYIRLTK